MTNQHITIILALIVGLLIGLFAATLFPSQVSESDAILAHYPLDMTNVADHTHKPMGAELDTPPSVDIQVTPDPKMPRDFIVQITTQNFEFAPDSASTEHVPGVGHAHIYVDDVKLNRVYGNWYHLSALKPGQHTVMVALNSNDHKEYMADGQPIMDSVTITVPAAPMQMN